MAVKHYLSEEVSKINLELYHLKEKNKLYQSKISLEESHHRDENTVLHLAFELLNKQNQLILVKIILLTLEFR